MSFVRRTALAVGLVAAAAFPAFAQDGGRVRAVVVQGNQRIEVETVKSYMAITEGDAYDADRVDRSLKALFNTGLFADVAIGRDGDVLVVRVVENPIINRIAFEGNKRIKDEELQRETQLRPRVVYTRTKVQNDVKRILDLYRRQGRFAATVEPKLIQLEQNRVDLAFEINEGEPSYVKRINFVGNRHYDDSRLREVLMTKEERWYRFLSSDDTYDPDRLTYDRELLRRYYLKHGYADFRVVSAVAELTPDRSGFFVTMTVDEGERYMFGPSDLKVALRDVDPAELQPFLAEAPEGEWYNADKVEEIVQKLTEALGTKGYAFVDVKPQVKRDSENRTIALTFDVQEGPRVYVERIDITGNVRTLDKVVRREFKLVEGDAFNTAKLRRTRQRLRDINFFEKVEVTNVPSETAPDRTVIKVDVQEKSTGELSFGIGWSTIAGALVEASLRERNLLGKGQDVRLSASVGERRNQLDFSFTEPYFLDRQLSAGVDAFAITRKLQSESRYDSNSVGGGFRMGYPITENLRQDWKYQLRRDQVENVSQYASAMIKEQEGSSTVSSVQQTLLWDYRDSRIEPTEGYYVRINNEVAGFGGTERFLRNNFGVGQYFPLAEQITLGLSLNGGLITGLDKKVRITDRYFLGGETLRGFATAGVSPRDAASDDALGGLWQYYGSAQVKFPLGLPEEFGFGGQIFTDFGAIGETETYSSATTIDQSSSMRIAVGAGVTWKSPMGPVAVDFGIPVKKEKFDERELFRFNFGTRF